MIIKSVHITGYGQFINRDFSFENGVNLIFGHNESGKSTLHSFISHMLYGMNRGRGKASRNDDYSRYCPWNYPDSFGGSMRVEINDKPYLIERSFNTSSKSLVVTNELTGEAVRDNEEYLRQLIGGISENAFNSTLSIKQMGANPGEDMSGLIKKHILNAGSTSSFNIDAVNAIKQLGSKKKSLVSKLNQDARKSYYETIENIDKLTLKLNEGREKIANMPVCDPAMGEELEKRIETLSTEADKLAEDYASLQASIEEKGFAAQADVVKIETEHNNLCRIYDNANKPQEITPVILEDIDSIVPDGVDEPININDIIKGTVFSWLFILALICFALKAPLPGALFIVIALLAGFYTAAPFIWSSFTGFPVIENALNKLSTALTRGKKPVKAKKPKKPKTKIAAAPMYTKEEAANELSKLYLEHLKKEEVTPENRQELTDKLAGVKKEFARLEALKKQLDAKKDLVSSNREKLLSIRNGSLDNAKLFWETDKLQEEIDELEAKKTSLALVLEENKRLKKEIEAVELALNTINELASDMHNKQAPTLNSSVSDAFNQITQRSCGELLISETLNITLNTSERIIPAESLSQGTIEQIYMALRLSAANMLFDGTNMPLILDEVFAMYDNPRTAQTLKYINSEHKGQTFILTCQNREKLVLEKLEIPFNYITLYKK